MGVSSASSRMAILGMALMFMTLVGQSYGQLRFDFYLGKCRSNNVEKVIRDTMIDAFSKDRTIVAALLRLHFHDAFSGSDASLLLDGAEKQQGPNLSVRGYEVIDKIKANLEAKCPGVVSCADIIPYATRDAVVLAGGKSYKLRAGRKDSLSSRPQDARGLPGPTISVSACIQLFGQRKLSVQNMVLLIGGGHSVGMYSCSFLIDSLYNFGGSGRGADPSMNPETVASLRRTCPRSGSSNKAACDQTPGSAFKLDKGFYQASRQGKGLLPIDRRMALDPLTRDIVRRFSQTGDFPFAFGAAMVRLSEVRVLTGSQGQVRRNCRRVNGR